MKVELPAELIQSFLIRRKSDFDLLTKALRESDIQPFKRIGHQLSGNADSYGFPELGVLGLRMEDLEEKTFAKDANLILKEFQVWINENVDG